MDLQVTFGLFHSLIFFGRFCVKSAIMLGGQDFNAILLKFTVVVAKLTVVEAVVKTSST